MLLRQCNSRSSTCHEAMVAQRPPPPPPPLPLALVHFAPASSAVEAWMCHAPSVPIGGDATIQVEKAANPGQTGRGY